MDWGQTLILVFKDRYLVQSPRPFQFVHIGTENSVAMTLVSEGLFLQLDPVSASVRSQATTVI